MKNIDDFNFEVSYSDSNYNAKPTSEEIKHMHFIHCKTNVNEFADKISNGYSYCSVFNKNEFGIHLKRDSNFSFTQVISVDIDKTTISLNEALKRLKTKPTMAYNTFSNGVNDKYCYRLVYIFENSIDSINDAKLYTLSLNKLVGEELNIKTDSNASKVSQYFNGTNDSNIFVSNCIYQLNDLKLDNIINNFNKDINTNFNYNINTNNNINNIKVSSKYIQQEHNNIGLDDTFKNDTIMIDDFWRLSLTDFLNKYDSLMPNIQNTKLDIPSNDEPFIEIPSDYREIKRYWYLLVDDKGNKLDYIRKIKDGEGRRKKLFLNGIIRRLINPQITFANMLHNIVWEFVTYMINDGNKITKQILWDIAKDVMNADLEKYATLGTTSRKWMVNPYFALKNNMSKREVINKFKHNKKQYIGKFYDVSLTDKENIEMMKSYGFEISIITLKRWRKENNITKYKKH